MKLSRRVMLKGASGAALSLPLLESLGCTTAKEPAEQLAKAQSRQALTFPKRIVFFYTPNGNLELPPTMDFAGSHLEPLTRYASKMVVLKGLDLLANDLGPGEPHQQGMALLTGRRLNTGTQVGGDGSLSGWAQSVSLDQHLANAIGTTSRFKTLNVGVQSTQYGGTEVRTVLSYLGNDQPVANETSPWSLYNRVFSQLGADPYGVARLRQRRHSVIDYVKDRFDQVKPQTSRADQLKRTRGSKRESGGEGKMPRGEMVVVTAFCARGEVASARVKRRQWAEECSATGPTKVSVDGEPIGSSSIASKQLTPGRRQIELVNEGAGISDKPFIDIKSGETLKLNLTLKELELAIVLRTVGTALLPPT